MIQIKKVFFEGAFWGALGTFGQQGLSIVSSIVLARFLMPRDFGIAAVALAATGIFSVISEMGFAQALIIEEEFDRHVCDSIFCFQILCGLLIIAVLFYSSHFISKFYRIPDLEFILKITGVGIMFSLSASVPRALLQRQLRFKGFNLILVLSQMVSSLVAVFMAIFGYGYWALIIPQILFNVVYSLLAFGVLNYWPRPYIRMAHIWRTANFGLAVLGTNMMNFFVNNGIQLVMGIIWPSYLLGVYNFAYRRASQPYQIFGNLFSSTLFPIFRIISHDTEKLLQSLLRLTKTTQIIIFPIYTLLIIYAPVLIPWIFGDQWCDTIMCFQILSCFILVRTFGVAVSNTFYALNKPEEGLKMSWIRFGLWAIALIFLLQIKAGVVTMALTAFVIDCLAVLWYFPHCYRMLNIGLAQFVKEMRSPMFALVLMLGINMIVCFLFPVFTHRISSVLIIIAVSLTGFAWIVREDLVYLYRSIRAASGETEWNI